MESCVSALRGHGVRAAGSARWPACGRSHRGHYTAPPNPLTQPFASDSLALSRRCKARNNNAAAGHGAPDSDAAHGLRDAAPCRVYIFNAGLALHVHILGLCRVLRPIIFGLVTTSISILAAGATHGNLPCTPEPRHVRAKPVVATKRATASAPTRAGSSAPHYPRCERGRGALAMVARRKAEPSARGDKQ